MVFQFVKESCLVDRSECKDSVNTIRMIRILWIQYMQTKRTSLCDETQKTVYFCNTSVLIDEFSRN